MTSFNLASHPMEPCAAPEIFIRILSRIVLVAAVLLSALGILFAAKPSTHAAGDPILISISPLGGQPGTRIEAKFRGEYIDGAFAIWCSEPGVRGKVTSVVKAHDVSNPKVKPQRYAPVYEALVELEIQSDARLGLHDLRIVSPRGVSRAIPFRVSRELMVKEASGPHQTVKEAQKVATPIIINGTVFRPGELDYYSFHAHKGDDLAFQVLMAQNFDARLSIYRAGGSWFDPNEPSRLLFDEERTSDLIPVQIEGTHRFQEDGDYFLEVSGLYGMGCPDCVYQVRICPQEKASEFVPQRREIVFDKAGNLYPEIPNRRSDWSERSFARRLDGNWAATLVSRSVNPPADRSALTASVSPAGAAGSVSEPEATIRPSSAQGAALIHPVVYQEHEANEGAAEAQKISTPAIVEGSIERPTDINTYQFEAKAGEKLAFEIETPDEQPPEFNPRLSVEDAQDTELFSNLYRRMALFNNNADQEPYLQNVVAKSLFTFGHTGRYVLQVRDITSRYGNSHFRYKILIRPQIPHVGEVEVINGDRVNVKRGGAHTLLLTTAFEEGFAGNVVFTLEGLPPGVQALPGAQLDPTAGPTDADTNPEIVSPRYQKTSIIVLADPHAPLTTGVRVVQLRGRAILDSKPGPSFLVASLPLTVVDPPKADPPEHMDVK